jgi:hypothetical protein
MFVIEEQLFDKWTVGAGFFTEYNDDNELVPMTFETMEEAQQELDGYLNSCEKAFLCGDVSYQESKDDYRIVEIMEIPS